MNINPRRLTAVAAVVAALLVAACSSSDGATTSPTSTPTEAPDRTTSTATPAPEATTPEPTASPTTTPPPALGETNEGQTADVANVVAHVNALVTDIGIRAAGTEGEREAAAYIAGVLEDAGYDTEIESFPITTRDDNSTVGIDGQELAIRPFMMNGSASGEATGPLLYAGLGAPEDLAPLDVAGRVLLLDRGVLPFGEKARNAELAGAAAVIVANDEAGPYNGNLGDRPSTIPVLAVTRAEGELLRPFADMGITVSVRASIATITVDSQNVVGRAGDVCRFYIGGHYDSVAVGPGANDNASGTALILELARAHRLDGLCVVAFGAEEIGLFGSRAFVAEHSLADALFMLNFDMAGRVDDALIIGDAALTELLLPAVEDLPIRAGQFPPFASSDHISFLDAGVAAVTITSGNDPRIHTAEDDIDNVSSQSLATMLEVGSRALTAALAAAG